MPVINRIAGLAPQMTEWRRHLHAHPELAFDCHETAAFVAARLREIGVDEIHEGIAQTGHRGDDRGAGAGPGRRAARRYGRAADPRGDGAASRLDGAGQDACLRP